MEAARHQAMESRYNRRGFFLRITAASITGAMVALTSFLYLKNSTKRRPSTPPGIACVQVHQNLSAYIANRINDPQLHAQISQHLFKCVSCQQAFAALQKGEDFDCSAKKTKFPPIHRP